MLINHHLLINHGVLTLTSDWPMIPRSLWNTWWLWCGYYNLKNACWMRSKDWHRHPDQKPKPRASNHSNKKTPATPRASSTNWQRPLIICWTMVITVSTDAKQWSGHHCHHHHDYGHDYDRHHVHHHCHHVTHNLSDSLMNADIYQYTRERAQELLRKDEAAEQSNLPTMTTMINGDDYIQQLGSNDDGNDDLLMTCLQQLMMVWSGSTNLLMIPLKSTVLTPHHRWWSGTNRYHHRLDITLMMHQSRTMTSPREIVLMQQSQGYFHGNQVVQVRQVTPDGVEHPFVRSDTINFLSYL